MFMGFEIKSSKIVDVDVDFLYELACEEAPYRNEEDSEDAKDILFGDDAYAKSPKLKKLFDEWDINKCEPIDLKKDGTIYMLNNGFHRIRVAKNKEIKTLKVNLQTGKFILDKHISISDLLRLLKMLREMFKEYKTFEELENFLSDPCMDKDKMKHAFIGFGFDKGDD